MQWLVAHWISFLPNISEWQYVHYCGKTFSPCSITVPKCDAVKLLCHPFNQSLLCDWPLVLRSMSTICSLVVKRMFSVYAVYSGEGKCLHTFAKIRNGNLLDSSIDSLIAVLYIWFANTVGLHHWMLFWRQFLKKFLVFKWLTIIRC